MKNYVALPVPKEWINAFEPLEWAKKHCPSYITNDAVQIGGDYYYRFYFGNDKDRVLFALRWA